MRANISQGPVGGDVSQGPQSKHGTEIAGIANKSGIFGSDNASNNLNATPREGLGQNASAIFSQADGPGSIHQTPRQGLNNQASGMYLNADGSKQMLGTPI